MQLESAPIGWPAEAAWWTALSTLRSRLQVAVASPPFELDEFALVGRVARRRRPTVYVYRHRAGGVLLVDDDGRVYRWFPRRDGSGQLRRTDWVDALDDAGLLERPLRARAAREAAIAARAGSCGARRAGWSRLAGRRRAARRR